MRSEIPSWIAVAVLLLSGSGLSGAPAGKAPPSRKEVQAALLKAVTFFHSKVASHGGYLWEYSGDLALREAEGRVKSRTLVWVQPPGTPAIGEAFLEAYEATGSKLCLQAARDAADVLVRGQMITGGWGYRIECDAEERKQYGYRGLTIARTRRWNRATVLDDDTTPAAIRFLARMDKTLDFKERRIHDAVAYALDSVLLAQYPNGSWFGWWEYYPKGHKVKDYPVKKASYPKTWPRRPGDSPVRWPARYVLNDDVVPDMIGTLLDAWDIYRQRKYLDAAKKAGNFLLLAQMPDPQPGWAQQYDIDMHPCWGRKFEPPAITGAESQTVMETLLLLHRRTGEKKYLDAVSRGLAYFKKSRLPDGRLARFYELKTNRPLYFNRRYELTYDSKDVPTHYKFIWESRLGPIEAECRRLLAAKRPAGKGPTTRPAGRAGPPSAKRVRQIINAMDGRGAWVDRGRLRFHKIEPDSGVIRSQAFVENVRALSRFLARGK